MGGRRLLVLGVVVAWVGMTMGWWAGRAEGFVYEATGVRDPMRPLVDADGNAISYGTSDAASAMDIASLQLEGVLWDLDDPVAIVNGDLVRVGDRVHDIEITEIHEEYIVVESGGDVRTIFLFPEGEGAF